MAGTKGEAVRYSLGWFSFGLAIGFLLGLLILAHARAATVPPVLPTVPGVVNPAVTQGNIHRTICVAGWSGQQRPSVSYTNKIKLALLKASGYADQNPSHYELDHLLSIENGGSPTDKKNLWLEYYLGKENAHDKDRLENTLHSLVCAGKMTLSADQNALRTNWIVSYRKYVGALP